MKNNYVVKKNHDVTRIISKRNSTANKYFIVYKDLNQKEHFRYVISVGKKYGNAVKRNKIKRQIREIIHQLNKRINNDFDILIIVRPTADKLSFNEIKDNLMHVLNKAKLIKSEVKYSEINKK